MTIRPERPTDGPERDALTAAAFAGHPHSDGSEVALLHRLAEDGDLALSLVATDDDGALLGHLALSPVTISDGTPAKVGTGWYGLGPMAVRPDAQHRGIGAALVREALAWIAAQGAGGCVLLGDPAFYGRLGFAPIPGLVLPGFPEAYFLGVALGPVVPQGTVAYANAFGVA